MQLCAQMNTSTHPHTHPPLPTHPHNSHTIQNINKRNSLTIPMKKEVILEYHILKEYVPRNRINLMPQNGDFEM